VMCASCHAKATGRICCGCSVAIIGEHIVADQQLFHKRCWLCAACRTELAGKGYIRQVTRIASYA
jgi:hypothetical protein